MLLIQSLDSRVFRVQLPPIHSYFFYSFQSVLNVILSDA